MNSIKIYIIGAAASLLLIMIPVVVIGAIVENPVNFLGEVIFGEGDTTSVSDEVKEMYDEFIKSDIGIQTLDSISEKNEGQAGIYNSTYYILPLLLAVDGRDEETTFEKLQFQEKIDILFELRYANSEDSDYLNVMKNHEDFKKLKSLSDTTLTTYINYFIKSSGAERYTVTGDSELGAAIAETALSQLGCPYYWGASGPGLYDCSGLVYWSCVQSGLDIPRATADDYANMGKAVTKEQLMAGDIITFDYEGDGRADHIGIYIGDGKMVHASGEGETCLGHHVALGHVVKITDVLDSDYWNKVIYNYRRFY